MARRGCFWRVAIESNGVASKLLTFERTLQWGGRPSGQGVAVGSPVAGHTPVCDWWKRSLLSPAFSSTCGGGEGVDAGGDRAAPYLVDDIMDDWPMLPLTGLGILSGTLQ